METLICFESRSYFNRDTIMVKQSMADHHSFSVNKYNGHKIVT